MTIYAIFIIFTCACFLVFGKRNTRINTIVLACAFIFMWLMTGLRTPAIGTDTNAYLSHFNSVLEKGLDFAYVANPINIFVVDGFEKGFSIYTYMITLITSDFTVYLLITYGFIYFSFYRFIERYSFNYLLSFTIFVSLFFFGSMNIMRQYIALAIVTWGFRYIIERKFIKYLAIVLLAVLFHQSSILMVLPYFIYRKKFTRLSLAVYGVSSLVGLSLVPTLVKLLATSNHRYETYLDKISVLQPGSFLIVGFYLILLILTTYLHQRSKKVPLRKEAVDLNDSKDLFLHMAALSVFMSVLAIQMSNFNRVIEYFSIFSVISLPFFFYCSRRMHIIKTVELILIGILILYAFTMLLLKPEWLNVWPYSNVL